MPPPSSRLAHAPHTSLPACRLTGGGEPSQSHQPTLGPTPRRPHHPCSPSPGRARQSRVSWGTTDGCSLDKAWHGGIATSPLRARTPRGWLTPACFPPCSLQRFRGQPPTGWEPEEGLVPGIGPRLWRVLRSFGTQGPGRGGVCGLPPGLPVPSLLSGGLLPRHRLRSACEGGPLAWPLCALCPRPGLAWPTSVPPTLVPSRGQPPHWPAAHWVDQQLGVAVQMPLAEAWGLEQVTVGDSGVRPSPPPPSLPCRWGRPVGVCSPGHSLTGALGAAGCSPHPHPHLDSSQKHLLFLFPFQDSLTADFCRARAGCWRQQGWAPGSRSRDPPTSRPRFPLAGPEACEQGWELGAGPMRSEAAAAPVMPGAEGLAQAQRWPEVSVALGPSGRLWDSSSGEAWAGRG